MDARPTNRLAQEKSPYLLQHAHNPVDWHPWGEEAFLRARAEMKPIFLSIGYSTCHWCHVMERETFEDARVGDFLRDHFVSIKVDREERPDVDKIYMTFVQSTTGGGGWPLNVFLTPDLKPFYGGTYFPPATRHGRPSFLQVLEQIAGVWRERQTEVQASAGELHARLELVTAVEPRPNEALTPALLRQALDLFKGAYDSQHGGFGDAPKFPQPSIPALVLRASRRFRDVDGLAMVLDTCRKMAAGGINDQLGGGFARYSVDAEWLVPHFEKMLYDNAQLAQLYLDAHLVAGESAADGEFAAVVRSILDYVLRDMTHPDGGFYSAEDADSEGHEGKFYCWTQAELEGLLTREEFAVAERYFGISRAGNFLDHSHPQPLPGQNVLSVVKPDLDPAGLALLASAKAKMLAARAGRVRPQRDDKVLASWNGLMLGAMARAGVVLGEERYLAAARKNLCVVRRHLWDETERALYHRWREGERDRVQLLEGYAFMLEGAIHLYEATLDADTLAFAVELAEAMLARFHDAANGGFWQSPAGTTDLILRVKDDYDGAEPSGNSVATLALLKLAAITGRENFKQAGEGTLQLAAGRLRTRPAALAFMLQALDFWVDEPRRVVLAAADGVEPDRALLVAAHGVYQPNKVVLGTRGAVEAFARTLTAKVGTTVYVCTGSACQAPTSEPARVRESVQ